eukprot:Skav227924  [mRNA]  locus=scaffold146:193423:198775:+ [translate_table: standard]
MGAAIHLSTKRQVIYGDYYLPVTVNNEEDHTGMPSSPPNEPEVTLSLMSGQNIKLTLSRRDATVKAARQQIAQMCCMPLHAVHLLNAGRVLEDELLLIGLESTQIIFDASFLKKGALRGRTRSFARRFQNGPLARREGECESREMGCLRLRSKRRMGPSDLDFVMPKVKQDGTAAQFRPSALKVSAGTREPLLS